MSSFRLLSSDPNERIDGIIEILRDVCSEIGTVRKCVEDLADRNDDPDLDGIGASLKNIFGTLSDKLPK